MRLRFLFASSQNSKPRFIVQYSSFSKITSDSTSLKPDPIYNHLLGTCVQECKHINTRHLFDERSQRLTHALKTSRIVHAQSLKFGFGSKGLLGNAIVDLYAKCGNVDLAEKVFNRLEERDILAWNSILSIYSKRGLFEHVVKSFGLLCNSGVLPNEFTFAMVLSACAKAVDVNYAGHQLHTVIIKNNFASNLFVGNALVDMYAKSGALKEARQQFERIRNQDHVSWNAIIVGYVQEGDEFEAFNMFRRMNLSWILPDEVSLASILSACANVQGLKQGKQIHCMSVKVGLETSIYSGSSLIDMYAKCGDIGAARKVLSCMPERGVVSMNALVAGYAQNNLEEAIVLYQEMMAERLTPNEITFASLLDACDGHHTFNLGTQIHCLIVKRGLLYDADFLGVSLLDDIRAVLKELTELMKKDRHLPEIESFWHDEM
ncbi:hypothetical protein Patl1_08142 [Pistacia atlantica]|uniref:Uncharacterized protein n=1 Tax=Pistacia atlantica TaxID=434234 RepID=A0ACC1AI29_9ROSI|nr:hypothetical protein Patl1_08142 [Pistacia atlantica]